jgi:hypothetical protein
MHADDGLLDCDAVWSSRKIHTNVSEDHRVCSSETLVLTYKSTLQLRRPSNISLP